MPPKGKGKPTKGSSAGKRVSFEGAEGESGDAPPRATRASGRTRQPPRRLADEQSSELPAPKKTSKTVPSKASSGKKSAKTAKAGDKRKTPDDDDDDNDDDDDDGDGYDKSKSTSPTASDKLKGEPARKQKPDQTPTKKTKLSLGKALKSSKRKTDTANRSSGKRLSGSPEGGSGSSPAKERSKRRQAAESTRRLTSDQASRLVGRRIPTPASPTPEIPESGTTTSFPSYPSSRIRSTSLTGASGGEASAPAAARGSAEAVPSVETTRTTQRPASRRLARDAPRPAVSSARGDRGTPRSTGAIPPAAGRSGSSSTRGSGRSRRQRSTGVGSDHEGTATEPATDIDSDPRCLHCVSPIRSSQPTALRVCSNAPMFA